MAAPPKIKKVLNDVTDAKSLVTAPPDQQEAQVSLLKKATDKSLNLPQGIHINHIDDGFVRFIEENFKINSQGRDIPIYRYSRQQYYEYTQQWLNNDFSNTPELPIITIIRESIPKKGSILGEGVYNIPTNETFNLFRQPVLRDGKQSYDLYRIPQPVTVDMHYIVSIISPTLFDIDKFSEAVLLTFASKMAYATVNGHYMSITIESDDDKSIKDLEKRRYYHHQYTMQLKGYLLDECRFEAVKSVSDVSLPISKCDDPNTKGCLYDIHRSKLDNGSCETMYKITFTKGEDSFDIIMAEDLTFGHDNHSAGNITYAVNDVDVTFPFSVLKGNKLTVSHEMVSKKNIVVKIYSIL